TSNASWGWGPTEKLSERQLTIMCELGWGPTQRNWVPISTSNASWGGGPTQRISKRNSTNLAN
ncbi:hypothetical protein LHK23_08475, partial [Staphylococcus argenteus]|nr:hypothetical protein [Staphylococcus argenteus]